MLSTYPRVFFGACAAIYVPEQLVLGNRTRPRMEHGEPLGNCFLSWFQNIVNHALVLATGRSHTEEHCETVHRRVAMFKNLLQDICILGEIVAMHATVEYRVHRVSYVSTIVFLRREI